MDSFPTLMRSQNTPTLCAVSAAPAAKEDWLTATRENWGAGTPCRPGHIAGTLPKFGQCLVELEYDDVAAPEKTPLFAMGLLLAISLRSTAGPIPVALDTIGIWTIASCGAMSGSYPLPDVVTRSGVGSTPSLCQYCDKFFRIVEQDARTRPEVGGARTPRIRHWP